MNPLERLNRASEGDAAEALRRCCGASKWVERMVRARPFKDAGHLHTEAERHWAEMTRDDICEAFAHHPKIGDVSKLREKFQITAGWASQEQKGVAGAGDDVIHALAKGNADYEARFGYIFIVCATGKTADEMLSLLRARLPNAPDQEIHVAAAEQAKITRIRLEKLLAP